jgi:hypothetical protein
MGLRKHKRKNTAQTQKKCPCLMKSRRTRADRVLCPQKGVFQALRFLPSSLFLSPLPTSTPCGPTQTMFCVPPPLALRIGCKLPPSSPCRSPVYSVSCPPSLPTSPKVCKHDRRYPSQPSQTTCAHLLSHVFPYRPHSFCHALPARSFAHSPSKRSSCSALAYARALALRGLCLRHIGGAATGKIKGGGSLGSVRPELKGFY